jgi:hypothetical protein
MAAIVSHLRYPMTAIVETDVRELRELILSLREETRVGFAKIDTKFVEAKADLQHVESELRGEIQRVESELKADIQRVESELKADIQRVESELKSDIQRVETKSDIKLAELSGKIDEVRVELNGKIDEAKAELGGKIDVLDERTRVGFWGFISRAVIIAILSGMVAFGTKFFFTGELTF